LFKRQTPQLGTASVVVQPESPIVPVIPTTTDTKVGTQKKAAELLRFLLRPLRRFTFLWCILLLVTTHITVVWLCLVVVLFHLTRDIGRILKALFFSDPWLRKAGATLIAGIDTALAGIAIVTPDTSPTQELKNLWNQLNLWTKVIPFLKDSYLVSRWAWLLGILFFGSLYAYIAVLFSFAYYGIARVNGVSYSWPDALVTSLFIPFFVAELPSVLVLRALGGLHCALVVGVGIGTFVNYVQRRLRSIHAAAMTISERLADQNIREKFLILEAKLATTPTATPPK